MSRKWTDNQQMAIDARSGSLLVSAAAGSGKTAVLVERVVQMVSDSEKQVPIERMLIVTYTRAAAAELKERISKTLNKLLSENPDNSWYRRQLMYLPCANISTVDSFCGNVVKEFFQELNIPGDYRIADNSELSILKDDAMQRTLDKFYTEGDVEFHRLVETFSNAKNDRDFQKCIFQLYTFLRSHPFEEAWLDEKLRYYTEFKGVSQSVWGKVVIDYVLSATDYCLEIAKSSLELAQQEEALYEKICDVVNDDYIFLEILKKRLESSVPWDEIHNLALSYEFGRFDARGFTNHPIKLKIADNRKEIKDKVKEIQSMLSKSESEIKYEVFMHSGMVEKLFECVKTFKKYYSEIKLSKNIADFSDVSHWTLDLLVVVDENGKTTQTPIAKNIADRFDAVMVDEFQDANEVQDLIFKAVSHNGRNLFVVGDVKQSIYGFRQAMPEIFLNRKNELPFYDPTQDNYPSKVILEKNFRSRKEITDFVNFVFSAIMSEKVGDMEYTEEEFLHYGASYPEIDTTCSEFHFLDLDSIIEEEDEIEGIVAEARYAASLIYEKCKSVTISDNGKQRPLRFGDIAILMRYTKDEAEIYARELRRFGIPVVTEKESGFLNLEEVTMTLNLLRVIDNPLQDVPLMSVLMSPVYGFTVDELARMRVSDRYTSLYVTVTKSADNGNEKAQRFIKQIADLRNLSISLSADRFLGVLYEKTGLLSIAQALGGELAYNNLCLLKEYAAQYEKGASKGISAFVAFVDRLISSRNDLSAAVSANPDNENVVRIMTIHSSKGLEFPLCIIANTHKEIKTNKDDDILVHSKLGFASKYRDMELLCDYNTFVRDALSLEIVRNERSEEVRVHYVALTRPKEQLVVLTTRKNLTKTISKYSELLEDSNKISPFLLRKSRFFSDWFIMIALMHPDSNALRGLVGAAPKEHFAEVGKGRLDIKVIESLDYDFGAAKAEVTKRVVFEDTDEDVSALLINRFENMKYADSELCTLPQKVTASAIAHKDTGKKFSRILQKPRFLSDSPLSSAERGTAMHTFMQYCDFTSARNNLDEEIQRLKVNNRLTKEQAESLQKDKLNAFLDSDLIKRAMNALDIYREYRFTVNIPAYLADDTLRENVRNHPIILQGSVDLAIVEEDGIIVVDYKTDRVKTVDELKERYHKQLELYKYALEQTTGKPVKSCLIYSVHLKESLEVL